ncbi:ATP-binding protein [Halanaerobium sp. MA284_MarDTE_T2]|uniref:ATP-binding protein n=1 Tax=Halanaerobium sp. MA284_MarDTE_T2 TaxID=2183913 RepID=UPI000E15590D|nr:AAA family ATPase [Halanaerobium sp. MA284_MarDTE_T2]RCW51437.1 AAA domain-containing protein [Halanaerobium sp. MA284_MarDTE_T2]
MYIKNLYIKDFGVFRISELKGLINGLNIIAGENRSGKTTLYKIMMNLGYGFSKSMNIPNPVNKYVVEAEIIDNSKDYSVQLNGYSYPVVQIKNNCESKASVKETAKQLYGNMDEFSYQNIFGISLDYLRTFPVGYTNKELSKLQSVLLGAGFNQIKKIPEIKEKYLKEAKNIGGKYGRTNVGEFKPYYSQIDEGLELQEKARNDFDKYYRLKKERKSLLQEKEETALKIDQKNKKLDFLDLLEKNYDSIEKYIRLNNKIKKFSHLNNLQIDEDKIKEFEKLKEKYKNNNKKISELKLESRKVSSLNIEEQQNILNYKNKIIHNARNISFYLEKIRNWYKSASELKDEKTEIIFRFESLLKKNLTVSTKIDKVVNSEIKRSRQDAEKIDSIKIELERLNLEKYSRKREIDDLKEKIEELKNYTSDKNWFFYSIVFLLILSGVLLSFFSKNFLAGILSIFSGTIIFSYFIYNEYRIKKEKKKDIEEIEEKIKLVKIEKDSLEKNIYAKNKKLEILKNRLDIYSKTFCFPETLDYSLLPDFIEELYDLQNDWRNWLSNARKFKDITDDIISKYRAVNNLYRDLNKFSDDIYCFDKISEFKAYRKHTEQFDLLEKILVSNTKLQKIKNENKEIIHSIKLIYNEIFNASKYEDRTMIEDLEKFFNDYNKFLILKEEKNSIYEKITYSLYSKNNDENGFDSKGEFEKILRGFSQYNSKKRVETERQDTEVELNNLKKRRENIILKVQDIETKLEELSSQAKLNESRRKIDKARKNLKKIAEKYAVNKLVCLILDKLQENFYKKIKNEYLKDASEIFKYLSNNDYNKIVPGDDLWSAKLDIVNNEDKIYHSHDMLSRGTEEQLFLSVRLSRIRKIKPPLPVIIDDSLVNFDIKHLERAVDEILKLSKQNQIILLTCHKRIIEMVEKKETASKSWLLKKGSFVEKDLKHLKKEMSFF